ncbi:AP2 domain protein [compost metagenome]
MNNQKANLRVCTHAENMKNRKVQSLYANKQKSSTFKGVYWYDQLSCWRADVQIESGDRIYIGLFKSEICAANAYNHFAKIYHREFALLNDVEFVSQTDWMKDKIEKATTSQFRGVSNIRGKWLAQIMHKGKYYNLGYFETEREAAKAYNSKAIELKGNKARLNTV